MNEHRRPDSPDFAGEDRLPFAVWRNPELLQQRHNIFPFFARHQEVPAQSREKRHDGTDRQQAHRQRAPLTQWCIPAIAQRDRLPPYGFPFRRGFAQLGIGLLAGIAIPLVLRIGEKGLQFRFGGDEAVFLLNPDDPAVVAGIEAARRPRPREMANRPPPPPGIVPICRMGVRGYGPESLKQDQSS
jgi:hypothetical protein